MQGPVRVRAGVYLHAVLTRRLSYSYRDILAIALPLAVGNLAYTLIAVFDVYFMKSVGIAEQGAIGYSSLVYSFLFMIGFSYTKGTQILVARRVGQGDVSGVGAVVNNSLVVLTVFAAVIWALITVGSHATLSFLFQEQAVIDAAHDYLIVRRWAFFFSFAGAVMIAYFSGIERTMVLAAAIVTMSVLNIFLNYVLIFGHYGFPALGIRGAAWASNIAEVVSLLILLLGTLRRGRVLRHALFQFKGLSVAIIRKISFISFPLVIQAWLGLGAWLIFFTVVENRMGQDALASSQVVRSIYMLLGVTTFAFASSTNTVVGNVLGQRRPAEVVPLLARISLLSMALVGLFTVPVLVMPRTVLVWFAEPGIVDLSVRPLVVTMGALFVYAVSTVVFNGIVATGRTYVTLTIELATIVVYSLYLWALFQGGNPTLAVAWTTEWIYWGFIGVLSAVYLWRTPIPSLVEDD